MFRVKNMSAEDFVFGIRLTDTMDWGLVRPDFELMVELEPAGCFVALDDSERAGLATTIGFGKIGWLGNVIVSENHRGRGVGSLLVKHSIEYLKNKHVETVGLYTYIDKIPFYRRFGFEYDSDFVVLKGKGTSLPVEVRLREAGKDDVGKIVDLDRHCFGGSRGKLLEPLLTDSDNLCYVSMDGGQLLGFVVAKVYDTVAEAGPLVCWRGREDIAINLLKTALNRLEGYEISMCIPKKESAIINALMSLGFGEAFRVARMFRGNPILRECIYAAESLERG